jgi:hypothetical protein
MIGECPQPAPDAFPVPGRFAWLGCGCRPVSAHFCRPPRGIFRKGRFAGAKIQVNFPKAEEIAGGAFDTDSNELGTFKDADLAAQALLDQQSNNPHRPTHSGAGKGIGAEDGNPNGNSIGGH